jgi:hypothetical protein
MAIQGYVSFMQLKACSNRSDRLLEIPVHWRSSGDQMELRILHFVFSNHRGLCFVPGTASSTMVLSGTPVHLLSASTKIREVFAMLRADGNSVNSREEPGPEFLTYSAFSPPSYLIVYTLLTDSLHISASRPNLGPLHSTMPLGTSVGKTELGPASHDLLRFA